MLWFTPDTIAFLQDLAENNDREWFHKHKKRYEATVKGPVLEFAAEMIEQMRKLDPEITMLPKNAVFRIHRDTRFSKDKAPYKTNIGLVVTRGAKHDPGRPGLYFHLDGKAMAVASGCYFLMPDQIRSIRELIMANMAQFEDLLSEPAFKETFGEIVGERNKILPPEFREAAAIQPLLFNKQFFYWAEHKPEEALRGDLPEFVMSHIRAAQPMNAFLSRAL